MITESIFALLNNNPGVTAILTPRPAGDPGIYPAIAPSSVKMPYIVYQQVSAAHIISYQGVNALQKATFQFACYATSFIVAHRLANAVKNVFNGLLADVPGGNPPVVTRIEGAWLQSERDLTEEIPHGTIFSDMVDYEFWFVDAG